METTGPEAQQPQLTPSELGKKTEETRIREMRFLKPLVEREDLKGLIDIQERDKFTFQQISGESPIKSDDANRHFLMDIAGLRSCVADGKVDGKEGFDIDHAIPFAHIQAKQEALLRFLIFLEKYEEFSPCLIFLGALDLIVKK